VVVIRTDLATGEDTSTPERLRNKNSPRVFREKQEAGKRIDLGGFRLLTPHAIAWCPHPSDGVSHY